MNLSHQCIKQQWRFQVQKIRHLANYCQACLGEKEQKNDPILTCGICESSIHLSHYGYQIVGKTTNKNHLTVNLDDWRCQRCRYLIEKRFSVEVKCEFCPFPRGIMKKVIFESSPNHRKQIWVHPECTTWCFPLIWIQSKKRTHYFKQVPQTPTTKFWFRVQDEPNKKCLLCSDSYGYKIKCTFYSCMKFYHITCAKRIGVIRDLQSMRFEQTNDDAPNYCPIYCEEHLQAMVLDFGQKVKLFTQKKENQKIAHFTKVHNCYKIQLKNLNTAAKKAKQEEEIRHQFGKQLMIGNFQQSSMSLSISEPRSNEMISSESEGSHSDTFLKFLDNNYELKDLNELLMKKELENGKIQMVQNQNRIRDKKHEKKMTKREIKVDYREANNGEEDKSMELEVESRYEEKSEISESKIIEESSVKLFETTQKEESKQMTQSMIVEQKELVIQEKYIQGAYSIPFPYQRSDIPQMMEQESYQDSISQNNQEQIQEKREKSEGQMSMGEDYLPKDKMEEEFAFELQNIEFDLKIHNTNNKQERVNLENPQQVQKSFPSSQPFNQLSVPLEQSLISNNRKSDPNIEEELIEPPSSEPRSEQSYCAN